MKHAGTTSPMPAHEEIENIIADIINIDQWSSSLVVILVSLVVVAHGGLHGQCDKESFQVVTVSSDSVSYS